MSLEALNGPGRNAASVTKAVAEISGFYKDVCAVFTEASLAAKVVPLGNSTFTGAHVPSGSSSSVIQTVMEAKRFKVTVAQEHWRDARAQVDASATRLESTTAQLSKVLGEIAKIRAEKINVSLLVIAWRIS